MEVIKIDIVVTIPKKEYKNDDLETEFLKENEDAYQFWTLGKVPKKLKLGDRVYFVKNNKIDSSMRFVYDELGNNHCVVTDRNWYGYTIFMDDLREENLDMKVKGFQGFRYKWW
jgi:hypothetical protein